MSLYIRMRARGLLFRFEGNPQVSVEQGRIVGFRQRRCPVDRSLDGTLHGLVAIARRDGDSYHLSAAELGHLHDALESRPGARRRHPCLLNAPCDGEDVAVQLSRTHRIQAPLLLGEFGLELAPPFGLFRFAPPALVLQPLALQVFQAFPLGFLPLALDLCFFALAPLLCFTLLSLALCFLPLAPFFRFLFEPLLFDDLLLANSLLLLFEILLPLQPLRFDALLLGGIRLRRFRLGLGLGFRLGLLLNHGRLGDRRRLLHVRLADQSRLYRERHHRAGPLRQFQPDYHHRQYQRV